MSDVPAGLVADRYRPRHGTVDDENRAGRCGRGRASGRPLFVVLDEAEREAFRARYAAVADLSWLDQPPILIAAKRVFFYQLWPAADDRARVLPLVQKKDRS